MEWKSYKDPEMFSEKIGSLLYENEDRNSLFLGILEQIRNGRYDEYYMALAEDREEILAACLMTPPHPLQLIIFRERQGLEEDLARNLNEEGVKVTGVIGDKLPAKKLAESLAAEKGMTVEVHVDEGLYRIDALASGLEKSHGSWRIANKKDAEVLVEWYLLFEKETGIGIFSSHAEATVKIERFLDDKEVYVWEVDGQMVSCMKKSRPSKHGITVSFVFTPKQHRRKGYARTLVAEVTEELLHEFDFVILYTDLKNPTSNKIYSEIGYMQIANPVYLRFIEN